MLGKDIQLYLGRFSYLPWLKRIRKFLTPKRWAILQACLIGLVAALAAVLLKEGVSFLGGWRVHLAHLLPAWIALPAIGLAGGLLAGWLIAQVAPEASGSGIPQVKAVLASVPIPLNLRVALVKLVSGMVALGCGLPLGREGPTVQVGAALANQLSRIFPTSPDYRRQMIAAGAGAGLAAAFNTPIAGILFVIEELLQDLSGFTLGTAILASLIGAAVSRWMGGHSLNLELAALTTSFFPSEIPFYLILGILAGLLGAAFNQGIIASLTLNRQLRLGVPLRVGLAGLVCGLTIALLPLEFRDSAGLREMLASRDFHWQFPAIAFASQFALTLLAYGSGAPGGLFAPALLIGSALGCLVGIAEHSLLGASSPTAYALAGMGAFFSAVARVPITGIVIVFEMTTDFNLVLPLMIGSVTAYWVADKLAPGSLYDRLLEWNGIHLEKEPVLEASISRLRAGDIMQRRVETLSPQMSLTEALQAFSHSQHHNFPVVAEGKLVGLLTEKDLASAARRDKEIAIAEVAVPDPMAVCPSDTLAHVLHLLNRYHLSCLPVVEGQHLVGIITHSDIIRAEVAGLNGEAVQLGPKSESSYPIYQTRTPAMGRGRLLVPLSNPETAQTLLEMAGAIARARHWELECLHVIVVPRDRAPTETPVREAASRRLLRKAVRFGRAENIPVHTQIRVAHEVAGAILEVVKERHIDLVLMGWKGSSATPGRVFSRVADTILRQAACEAVLVKLGDRKSLNRWLVPMAGGPNAREAVRLLPTLLSLSQEPEVRLCQVFPPHAEASEAGAIEEAARFLKRRVSSKVSAIAVVGNSVPEAVIEYARAEDADAIVVGASRDKLLQQAVKGNIPEAIARHNCTVILVRTATVAG